MIKAVGESGGKPLLLLGLSGENMARLMADEPIRFDTTGLGLPPMVVVIMGGRTEQEMLAQLTAHGMPNPARFALPAVPTEVYARTRERRHKGVEERVASAVEIGWVAAWHRALGHPGDEG